MHCERQIVRLLNVKHVLYVVTNVLYIAKIQFKQGESLKKFLKIYVLLGNLNIFCGIFTVVPCILILSKSFIYQLMHNRVALKEY
jgi:hypothetical protein